VTHMHLEHLVTDSSTRTIHRAEDSTQVRVLNPYLLTDLAWGVVVGAPLQQQCNEGALEGGHGHVPNVRCVNT
jgi:hypothetical protein